VPDLNRHPENDRSTAGANAEGRLQIQDLGQEVHLSFAQRVPWKLALRILEALKTDVAQDHKARKVPQPPSTPEGT
jgi:hypothetical protein